MNNEQRSIAAIAIKVGCVHPYYYKEEHVSNTHVTMLLFATITLFISTASGAAGGYLARRGGANYPDAAVQGARAFAATVLVIASVVASVAAWLKN